MGDKEHWVNLEQHFGFFTPILQYTVAAFPKLALGLYLGESTSGAKEAIFLEWGCTVHAWQTCVLVNGSVPYCREAMLELPRT